MIRCAQVLCLSQQLFLALDGTTTLVASTRQPANDRPNARAAQPFIVDTFTTRK
jgi:hypothetical protein